MFVLVTIVIVSVISGYLYSMHTPLGSGVPIPPVVQAINQYHTILYYTILYYTILLQYTIIQYYMLCYATLHYTILYHTILYYSILALVGGADPTGRTLSVLLLSLSLLVL